MGILRGLFGRKDSGDERPGESFSIMQAMSGGHPIVASINMAYRRYRRKADFPWHLRVTIPLIDPRPDGLTTSEEAKDLNQFEDTIGEALMACAPHFVGRTTGQGRREILYYLDSPGRATGLLQAMMDSGRCRAFTFRCEQDSRWQALRPFWR